MTNDRTPDITLQLTTLTPVTIGDGEKLSPYNDYALNDGRVTLVDKKMIKTWLRDKPELLEEYIEGVASGLDGKVGSFNLHDFITQRMLLNLSEVALGGSISPGSHLDAAQRLPLTCTQKTPGRQPCIPPGPLKGIIKTALLYDWLTINEAGKKWLEDYVTNIGSRKQNTKAHNALEEQVRRYWLGLTDANTFDADATLVYAVERVHLNPQTATALRLAEGIKPSNMCRLGLTLDAELTDDEALTDAWETLKEIMNKYTLACIQKELKLMQAHKIHEEAAGHYKSIQNAIRSSDNAIYSRLGSSNGYFVEAVGLAYFDKYQERYFDFRERNQLKKMKDPDYFYFTKNILEKPDVPLGWVKIELAD